MRSVLGLGTWDFFLGRPSIALREGLRREVRAWQAKKGTVNVPGVLYHKVGYLL